MKRCVVSVRGSQERHGVAADSLQELRDKALRVLGLDASQQPLTLVLAEDGTIVEDEDYFLCLPEDTEFLVLYGNKKWAPCSVDGGTAWLARESVSEMDDVDSAHVPRWRVLAAQLKENLSNIILFSESDFQTLIDVTTEDLSREMEISPTKTVMLKDTLQGLLDRQEEERRCKELLQLYLEAVQRDDPDGARQPASSEGTSETDSAVTKDMSQNAQLSSYVLRILQEKTLPHLSLSNEQLECVCSHDPHALSAELNCSLPAAQQLQEACQEQLELRLQQVQCMNSLASASHKKRKHLN
ncbi:DNA fragmentation factor subunit alpha-like [Hyperolius riggenbachi]|uniref:DNA fragmentation factor subunit alpha-like n=1 Tax=Hyperolius riggenbachi TaxID=752182 RepID=UPI0035A34B1E